MSVVEWIPVVLAFITLMGTVAGGLLWISKKIIGVLTDELKESRNDYKCNVEASTAATNNLAEAVREQTALMQAERKLSASRHKAILRAIARTQGGVTSGENSSRSKTV